MKNVALYHLPRQMEVCHYLYATEQAIASSM